MTSILTKADIAALIPHTGAMCLLDQVLRWDRASIVCFATSHRDPDNPLACDGRLDVVCGIEYAAQAMAIHAGLTATSVRRPDAGYLASVREVICHAGRLDLIAENLEVSARLLTAETGGAIYLFRLRSGMVTLLKGRAAVVLDVRSDHRSAG